MAISQNHQHPILVVDDDVVSLGLLKRQLHKAGINNVITCNDSTKVMELFSQNSIEIALIDLQMPNMSGQELLQKIQQNYAEVPVIIVTGSMNVPTVVQCTKDGAFDYLTKPADKDILFATVNRALRIRKAERENQQLRLQSNTLQHPERFKHIITRNEKMMEIFCTIETISSTSWPVLVTGETGVGKEMVSKSIHVLSNRKGPFIPVNVAGLDDILFSDTLFGHVKGAFTGADKNKKGLIEQAASGTLFLDEIGDLSPMSQTKLLRLVQEGEYLPLGSDKPRKANIRIVAATNKNLWDLQRSGHFREDLNYRLRTHHIHIPPLRERKEDLPLLIDHFLNQAAIEQGKKKPTVPNELSLLLQTHPFHGNIRELQAMIVDALSKHKSRTLSLSVFKSHLTQKYGARQDTSISEISKNEFDLITFHENLPSLKLASHLLINEAMKRANNNQSIAATMLGITQSALSKRINRGQ
ncbi:MAG: two-component system response regulator [Desulfobacterium sp.]|nr:two-component system response regulator [Desulfobacterium sp.]